MPPTDHPVSLNVSGPSPDPVTGKPGDTITFTNSMSVATTVSFDPPSCISPPTDLPLAAGASSTRNINATAAKGHYGFGYGVPSPKRDTRTGTIDVD